MLGFQGMFRQLMCSWGSREQEVLSSNERKTVQHYMVFL